MAQDLACREHYFATVARGLEPYAAAELEALGADTVEPGFCGVSFRGDRYLLYKVNLWARLPFRILLQLGEISSRDGDDLYHSLQAMDWSTYLTPEQTLAVTATGKNRRLNHTHFTAVRVKQAIVDQQQRQQGARSSVDTQQPDVRVNVHIHSDRCTVSLDSSGSSLHRRGYRPAMGQAPLKESLAAALIQMTGWQPHQPFCDPLCGSGTLPLEASLKALNIAPGLFRDRFGFETWPDFEVDTFQQLVEQARAAQHNSLSAPIVGCDQDGEVLHQARINARNCGVRDHIRLLQADLAAIEPPADHGILLCNPPYGERLGTDQDLGALYRLLGDVLKQRFKGWTAFVLSGNKALAKTIGLKSARRIPVLNGAIQCQLMQYELY